MHEAGEATQRTSAVGARPSVNLWAPFSLQAPTSQRGTLGQGQS